MRLTFQVKRLTGRCDDGAPCFQDALASPCDAKPAKTGLSCDGDAYSPVAGSSRRLGHPGRISKRRVRRSDRRAGRSLQPTCPSRNTTPDRASVPAAGRTGCITGCAGLQGSSPPGVRCCDQQPMGRNVNRGDCRVKCRVLCPTESWGYWLGLRNALARVLRDNASMNIWPIVLLCLPANAWAVRWEEVADSSAAPVDAWRLALVALYAVLAVCCVLMRRPFERWRETWLTAGLMAGLAVLAWSWPVAVLTASAAFAFLALALRRP